MKKTSQFDKDLKALLERIKAYDARHEAARKLEFIEGLTVGRNVPMWLTGPESASESGWQKFKREHNI